MILWLKAWALLEWILYWIGDVPPHRVLLSWQNFNLLSGTVPCCVADDRKHWWLVPCLCWLWGLFSTHLKAWPNFTLNRGFVLLYWQSFATAKIQLEHAVNTHEDYSFFQSPHREEKKPLNSIFPNTLDCCRKERKPQTSQEQDKHL